jgi:hypothetical protein
MSILGDRHLSLEAIAFLMLLPCDRQQTYFAVCFGLTAVFGLAIYGDRYQSSGLCFSLKPLFTSRLLLPSA